MSVTFNDDFRTDVWEFIWQDVRPILEEHSDALIEDVIQKVPLPGFLMMFLKGPISNFLDDLIPDKVLLLLEPIIVGKSEHEVRESFRATLEILGD